MTRNLLAVAVFPLIVLSFMMGVFVESRQTDWWLRAFFDEREARSYYFKVANDAGLLDLCPNAHGQIGVWLKSECKEGTFP